MSDWFEVSAGVCQGCVLAPELFLESTDWIVSRSVHRGFVGITLGQETFTDLDFADDVALMAKMFEVLIVGLEVMNEESSQLGLEINWSKTKIQASESIHGSSVPVLGHS